MTKKDLLFILSLLLLLSGCKNNVPFSVTEDHIKNECAGKSEKPDLEIYIDLTEAGTGKASISMILKICPENRPSYFIGRGKEFQMEGLKFYGEKDKPIYYLKDHENICYQREIIKKFLSGTV
jgi:hypothetical protein